MLSVLGQSDPDWRLTLVDDNPGNDGTEVWLASLGDSRVRYRHNARNLGINRNFQQCIDLADSELVVIIGVDDVMLPDYVRTVRAAHLAFRMRGERLLVDPTVWFQYRRHRTSVSAWRAADGSRFLEKERFFVGEAARMRRHGWHRAANAASRHVSSRINALTMLAGAMRARDRTGIWNLARHALSRA